MYNLHISALVSAARHYSAVKCFLMASSHFLVSQSSYTRLIDKR